MLVSRLRQRLAIPTVFVRAIGMYAALFLLLVLVVGCGGQSSSESPAPEPDPKSEPTTESGSNKREVALEEGSLRGLGQERIGNFELQNVKEGTSATRLEIIRASNVNAVEALGAEYVGPGGALLEVELVTTRSPEAADNARQQLKENVLSEGGGPSSLKVVDERPVEASGRRVGTLMVMQGASKEADPLMVWNNGNLLAWVAGADSDAVDAVKSFYESLPY